MFGKLLCKLGYHKWTVIGKTWIEKISKWEMYEVGHGKCDRCGHEAEVRKDYYW